MMKFNMNKKAKCILGSLRVSHDSFLSSNLFLQPLAELITLLSVFHWHMDLALPEHFSALHSSCPLATCLSLREQFEDRGCASLFPQSAAQVHLR